MATFADLALHKPIRLSRAGSGASDSVIWSGVASGDNLLHGYPLGTAEVTRQARLDTARGLVGVPIVSPEDHQAWAQAHAEGKPYRETVLGTVLDADWDAATDTIPWSGAVHVPEYNRRIALPETHPDALPMVSVAYEADIGDASHPDADFAQLSRRVRHLALVPKGRDSHAHIFRDAADSGVSMPTLAEIKAKHPAQYAKARRALMISRAGGVAVADAISLDKAIPLIKEMMADDVGKLVLHALVNAPAELAEIERGGEEIAEMDEDPEAEMDGYDGKKEMAAMADAIAALRAEVAEVKGRVKPLVERQASADAAAEHRALLDRAARLKTALDHAGVQAPSGFDASKPTAALCDAADAALVDAFQKPRTILGPPRADGKRLDGSGRPTVDAASDSVDPTLHLFA